MQRYHRHGKLTRYSSFMYHTIGPNLVDLCTDHQGRTLAMAICTLTGLSDYTQQSSNCSNWSIEARQNTSAPLMLYHCPVFFRIVKSREDGNWGLFCNFRNFRTQNVSVYVVSISTALTTSKDGTGRGIALTYLQLQFHIFRATFRKLWTAGQL